MNAAREAWFEGQLDLDPTHIVFIDETAANTKMARLYGHAPRGERCRAAVPHGHWKTTTFTAGLRYDGIAAPMVLDGPTPFAASPRKNAPITSPPQDTMQYDRKLL